MSMTAQPPKMGYRGPMIGGPAKSLGMAQANPRAQMLIQALRNRAPQQHASVVPPMQRGMF